MKNVILIKEKTMYKYIIVAFVALSSVVGLARTQIKADVKAQVQAVLSAGDKLHESFFEYDGAAVEKAAKVVSEKIDAIKSEEISKLLKVTKEKLASITKSSSEEGNKENYYIVSLGLGNIINKYDVGGKWNIYSCPMVKKKWIQDSSKVSVVQNPYAAGMPNCGSKDTDY